MGQARPLKRSYKMEVQDTNTAAAEGLRIDTGASTDWFQHPTKNELRGITVSDLDLRWEALRDEALLIDPNYFSVESN